DETGEDEEKPGQRAAGIAALLVSDVDRELQRFRAGQDMAEVQRADELLLVDPLLPFDDLQVHQADLTDRPAECEPAQLEEVPEDLPHRRVQMRWPRGKAATILALARETRGDCRCRRRRWLVVRRRLSCQ